ncbi:Cyclin-dependent kinase inhibitor 3 [Bagarius yarrelli]|uniref:protein-tyrosine-phosphatase n=1 Tax=Bagarius yarrelli TaxID=175774 RepID=A0A556VV59_BAGYA|nr:Cyclin-dependent kinase inhibitor 3 [Bagarius yarrelli]
MRVSEFDSSDEEDGGDESYTPLQISWAELVRYRVPCLLECYTRSGLCVHHLPFPDGNVPEVHQCTRILDELQHCLHSQRRTVIHCYGGLGRSGLIAACLLLHLSTSMTPTKAIEILRELRGGGAIQTVKQYNFLHEFREILKAYQETKESRTSERAVSR